MLDKDGDVAVENGSRKANDAKCEMEEKDLLEQCQIIISLLTWNLNSVFSSCNQEKH